MLSVIFHTSQSTLHAPRGQNRRSNISGMQVNVAGRAAAVAPGSADTLAAFAGHYQTHQLPNCAGKPSDAGSDLEIKMDAAGVCASISGCDTVHAVNSSLLRNAPLSAKRAICKRQRIQSH